MYLSETLQTIGWTATSPKLLEESEKRILSRLKTPHTTKFVNIGPAAGDGQKDCSIWTISMNQDCVDKIPLVLVHGLGAGIGYWSLNIDSLAGSGRPIHAFDLLGFARSSRPQFSPDAAQAEQQFVAALEEWRKCMKLSKFILLGHSLGGFISMAYALAYPERLAHLILADPWGFAVKPPEDHPSLPFWVKVASVVTKPFNALSSIRAAGPMGQTLMGLIQGNAHEKFLLLNEIYGRDDVKFGEYAYHCNAQEPTGEEAFRAMSDFIWAKRPMTPRISDNLHSTLDLTVMYGSNSFIPKISLNTFLYLRGGASGYTNVAILEGAGHEIFLDNKEDFDSIVLQACLMADGEQK